MQAGEAAKWSSADAVMDPVATDREEKFAAKIGARMAPGKPMIIGTGTTIYLGTDETPVTLDELRALVAYARSNLM